MADVLNVEDQSPIARLLSRWVEEQGAHPVMATSAEQAISWPRSITPRSRSVNSPAGKPPDFWFLSSSLCLCHPATVAVMTTSEHNIDTAMAGLRPGMIDYLPKLYSRDRLTLALKRGSRSTSHAPRHSQRDSGHRRDASTHLQTNMTTALLTILHADDGVVAWQGQRVSRLAVRVAEELRPPGPDVSDIELEPCCTMCVRGLDMHAIVRNIRVLVAAAIAVAVEERCDGNDFPLGLRGAAIPLSARIIGLVRAYDERTTGGGLNAVRPHEAVDRLCEERAAHFAPRVFEAFRAVASELQTNAA